MLGVCYYPEHWPESLWSDDARRMRELGLTYVRIGEFAWSRLEPEPGRLEWEWLDRAIDVLHGEGLRVVLGTPTATPPKWLVEQHPDVTPIGKDGRPRGFGSRRHYDFSSPSYRRETERIVRLIAERYGNHPGVAGWQTDNEYGCHDTVRSYSPAARDAFRRWLAARYENVASLNEAWGNVFWSMEYRSFEEVELPNLTVTEANPAHVLDYRRFASDEVRDYNRLQVGIIHEHSPGRFITHNFMGFFTEFDHYPVGQDLDVASWDSYPLGGLEESPFPDEIKRLYARDGHPDMTAFSHDLYRRVGKGRFWVMEQQPGPVNWAARNPAPSPGAVRRWTWEAIAQGAEVVSYFRWRQAPFAQEQMHAGLNRPDNSRAEAWPEVERVARELGELELPPVERAPVALVYDYQSDWVLSTQPQGQEATYRPLVFSFYSALRALGLDVDVVAPGDDLSGYALAVVPSLPIVSGSALAALTSFEGPLVIGPRSGSKTEGFQIPGTLPPGPLQALLPLRVTRVESLRPGVGDTIEWAGGRQQVGTWLERIESDMEPVARFSDGSGAAYARGNRHYLGFWPDPAFLAAYFAPLAGAAGLQPTVLPEGLRLRRRGNLTFAFNSNSVPLEAPVPQGATFLIGNREVEPHGLSVWR
jgi:beta-galactosidase